MSIRKRCAILAIGTEVADGQIINRNAAWMASRLVELGFEVVLHLVVGDELPAILKALDQTQQWADLAFLTGGLGPTSDDITRSAVAQWAQKNLSENEESWRRIQEKLQAVAVALLPAHRYQAQFPEGARVLVNPVGTADGFCLKTASAFEVWVLPGPPRELQGMWQQEVAPQLELYHPAGSREKLKTWQCIGQSESQLAALTEEALAGTGLRLGYRLMAPYVEIKVWCTVEQQRQWAEPLQKLDQVLSPWVMLRDGEDLLTRFENHLPQGCGFRDGLTEGYLAERLNPLLRKPWSTPIRVETLYGASGANPEEMVRSSLQEGHTFALSGFAQDGSWAAGHRLGGQVTTRVWPRLGSAKWWQDRGRRVACELALKYWSEEL